MKQKQLLQILFVIYSFFLRKKVRKKLKGQYYAFDNSTANLIRLITLYVL